MPADPGTLRPFLRFVGRYLIACAMIPVGVALGIGGLIQHAWRRKRGTAA